MVRALLSLLLSIYFSNANLIAIAAARNAIVRNPPSSGDSAKPA